MKTRFVKPIVAFTRSICVLFTLFVLSCNSEDSGGSRADYLGSWVSETPFETTVSMAVDGVNGQSDIVDTHGQMTVIIEFIDNGTLRATYDFISVNPPLCSSESPCALQGTFGYAFVHRYKGKRVTIEGLQASHIRIVKEDDSSYADGNAWVSEDRLCISNGLWDFLTSVHEVASDPLATDFDKCFVRN